MKVKKEVKTGNRINPVGKAVPAKKIANSHQLIANSYFETFIKENPLLVFNVTSFLLLFIVFHRYLLLHDTYLFKDIGSDTVNDFYPRLVHFSEYFRTTGFPKWSFNDGPGKNIYPLSIGDPFSLAIALLPKDIIPYSIVFAEVLKIYLGGLFFFLFLKVLKLPAFTCIIGGLLYSFSGFMIIGSSMYIFSTEAFYASFVLYSCEKFLRYGNWFLLPVPFFLFAAFQPFLLYLYGLLITIYCIVRISVNEGWQWEKMTFTVLRMGALAFLGVLMSSFIFLSNIDMLLHTSRGFGGEDSVITKMASTSIFHITSFWEITTSLYRFFSNDIIGSAKDFKGYQNYVEAPALFAGLLTCLLIPQAFFLIGKRKKVIYLGLTLLAIIPLFSPLSRHLFWLFSGDYYRTYSLFLSMLFLMLCLKSLAAIGSINTRVLFITLAVLLFLLFCPFNSPDKVNPFTGSRSISSSINNTIRLAVAFFLILYTFLIYLFNIPKLRMHAFPLLGIAILIELSCFSMVTVNTRDVISSAELHEKTGYNDYTNEAVAYINSKDSGFFRIFKDYSSSPASSGGGFNDGLIQNYKSNSDYNSFNQPNYIRFLNEMNVWNVEKTNSRWINPSPTRPLLAILLNEKYFLTNKSEISSLYDSVTKTGNVTVTKYKIFLPFGYTYQNYISLSEFRKLNNFQKDKMLFQAFVADSTDAGRIHESSLRQLYAKDTVPGASVYFNEFNKYTAVLRKDSLSNLVYTQNTVKGTIKPSQTKLLFFSIPYDNGWQFKVDGTITKPLMANIGFMGVVLEKGEHTIELNYEPPFLKLGCYISGFSLLGYLVLFIRYRKKRF